MKNFVKKLAAFTIAAALGLAGTTAFAAAAYQTPAEAVAGLTGRTTQEVIDERINTGKTYGTIAQEAGKLEEFQSAMLEMAKDRMDELVSAGGLTQEQADARIDLMEQNQVICNGTGIGAGAGVGGGYGRGYGCGGGYGRGMGGGCGRW